MGAELTLHGEVARFDAGFTEVAPGTWAYMQPNGGLGESNAGLIFDGDHVMFVDSLWDIQAHAARCCTPRAGSSTLRPRRSSTHTPTATTSGATSSSTGARIISTTTAKDLMTLDPPKALRAMQRGGNLIGAIGRAPLPFIGPRDYGNLPRLPLKDMGNEMAPFDWSDIKLTLPTETFDGALTVQVGSRERRADRGRPGAHDGRRRRLGARTSRSASPRTSSSSAERRSCGPDRSRAGSRRSRRSPRSAQRRSCPATDRSARSARSTSCASTSSGSLPKAISQLDKGVAPAKAARNLLLSRRVRRAPVEWLGRPRPSGRRRSCTEQFRRSGGKGQLGGAARSRVITQMQLTKTAMGRRCNAKLN